MDEHYSKERQVQCGVVAFELKKQSCKLNGKCDDMKYNRICETNIYQ